MQKIWLVWLFAVFLTPIFGQKKQNESTKSARKIEIGLNVTSTLAGFFNSGGDQIPIDPFLVSLKLVNKKNALRLGFNIRISQKDEAISGLDGSRNIFDTRFDGRFGFERRKNVTSKFGIYYGVDAVGFLDRSKVDFTSSLGLATLTQSKLGIGGGPFMGVNWSPFPQVVFGTEATMYALFFRRNEKRSIPLEPILTKKSVGFDLASIPPTSLYIHFKF
jgi:hypothetical protein